MPDSRKKARKRTELLTLRFFPEELEALRQLAAENYRSPADQIRALIAEAVTQKQVGA